MIVNIIKNIRKWALKSNVLDAYSAGIETHGLNPIAAKVMAEAVVNISNQKCQLAKDLPIKEFDYVITVCSHAHENCPYFPAKTEKEVISIYRKVRDEIKAFIETLPESII